MVHEGGRRGQTDQHRVPIEDAGSVADAEVRPERLEETPRPVDRHAANDVAEGGTEKHCQEQAREREDDIPDTIKEQLRWYDDKVTPVINLFRSQNIVHDVDADGSIDSVHRKILEIFVDHQDS